MNIFTPDDKALLLLSIWIFLLYCNHE